MRSRMLWLAVLVVAFAGIGFGQQETATVSGRITDTSGAAIQNATVVVVNQATKVQRSTASNEAGLYVVPALQPGTYRIIVKRDGFSQFVKTDIVLHVQDAVAENFELRVGSVSESVTVSASTETVNTTDASVGTVIDSKFVSNIPLNGRTFQELILLAPGVVLTPVNNTNNPSSGDGGMFSVNGQRANTNNFTVDGVSANFGVGTQVAFSQSASGSLPATNNQGSFSSLVSADDLQEFKIQTSSFAPEFGRTPGAQISLVTKSGTNKYHGSVFEYLRNDAADANDWFADHLAQPKAPLRFNDFGASFGGPIWKDKTFFFFSYEGQRFTLPQPTATVAVPSMATRNAAPNSVAKQLVDAFPIPNGADIDVGGVPTGGAWYTSTYSIPNNADTYSLRIDHNVSSRLSLFARYNQSPSNSFTRQSSDLSGGTESATNTKTITLGSSWSISPTLLNELRLNGSEQTTSSVNTFDGYGGGVLPDPSLFLSSNTLANSAFIYYLYPIADTAGNPAGLELGQLGAATARSINLVDDVAWTKGKHALKFGIDYRYYTPSSPPTNALIGDYFLSMAGVFASPSPEADLQLVDRQVKTDIAIENYSLYAQDTWSVNPRLTLTYGLRWEINPPPHARSGDGLVTLTGPPNLNSLDQSNLQLAPVGTPYYNTQYDKFAPRVGVAYELSRKPGHETVIRASGGLFYDLNSTPFAGSGWPYDYQGFGFGAFPVPVPASTFNFPAPNFTPSPSNLADIDVAGKGYTLPETYQWNLSIQQALGADQSLTLSYVGSAGRKLLRSMQLFISQTQLPGVYYSPDYSDLNYTDNAAQSDYNSFQAQYMRRLAKGFQVIANYTWSHSTDDVSTTEAFQNPGYIYSPMSNWGASSFDVRHSFTAAYVYQIPTPKWNSFAAHTLGGWSLSGTWIVRSGMPYNLQLEEVTPGFNFYSSARRPNINPGVPLIVSDPTAPGGWRINNAVDANGNPLAFSAPVGQYTQGDEGRDSLYGFGAWQADMGLHRDFRLGERVSGEFRVEAFNIFNHPNFSNPFAVAEYLGGQWTLPDYPQYNEVFGESTQTMARGFSGGAGAGLSPLFQVGGPRDMQVAIRFTF